MKIGKYQIIDMSLTNGSVCIETDGGNLTISTEDVRTGKIALMPTDNTRAVEVSAASTIVASHTGDITNMLFALRLPVEI